MTQQLLSDLSEEEYQRGLQEIIDRFSAQLMRVEDPFLTLHGLKVVIGEKNAFIIPAQNESSGLPKYAEPEENVIAPSHNVFPREVETIDRLIRLYQADLFDPSQFEDFYDGTATHRRVVGDPNFGFPNEKPVDSLRYLMPDYPYLKEIVEKGYTQLYSILEQTIQRVLSQADAIRREITESPDAQDALNSGDLKSRRLAYYKQEFLRKDKVIPLLEEMKLIYQTAIRILKGISEKHAGLKPYSN